MLKIKFADGTEKEILQSTTVYPSGSSSVRSKMEIHMSEYAMSFVDFESLMSDSEKTKELHIIETDMYGSIVRENVYSSYILPAQIGKQRVDIIDYEDGQVNSEMHLVAELEQLTYIEQQLNKLGVALK